MLSARARFYQQGNRAAINDPRSTRKETEWKGVLRDARRLEDNTGVH